MTQSQSKKLLADNTSIYLCLNNDEVCTEILNSDLEKISTSATKWKATCNSTKTELMNIYIMEKRASGPIPKL